MLWRAAGFFCFLPFSVIRQNFTHYDESRNQQVVGRGDVQARWSDGRIEPFAGHFVVIGGFLIGPCLCFSDCLRRLTQVFLKRGKDSRQRSRYPHCSNPDRLMSACRLGDAEQARARIIAGCGAAWTPPSSRNETEEPTAPRRARTPLSSPEQRDPTGLGIQPHSLTVLGRTAGASRAASPENRSATCWAGFGVEAKSRGRASAVHREASCRVFLLFSICLVSGVSPFERRRHSPPTKPSIGPKRDL